VGSGSLISWFETRREKRLPASLSSESCLLN
jgi:hypothetical protein